MRFRHTKLGAAVAAAGAIAVSQSALAQFTLEEVIVTAQKRESTLQDIAATVNVIGGEVVDEYSVLSFNDLEQLTSGLSLTKQNSRNATVSMRGISNDPESGGEPGVDIYYNGVLVRPDTAFSQIYDLERIEILRGPQGALQGRTSPGGAILMNTKKASLDETNGSIQFTSSDNGGTNIQVAVGTPIIEDVLAVRFAGAYDENNGNNVTNITTGRQSTDLGRSGRLSLNFTPGDAFEADFMHQYYERYTDDPKILLGPDPRDPNSTLTADDRTALASFNDLTNFRFNLTTLNTSWDLGSHEVSMIIGHNESSKFAPNDEKDRANIETNGPTDQFSTTTLDTDTIEIRLTSTDNEFWEYMVGLFWLDQKTATVFDAKTTVSGTTTPALSFASGGFAISTVGIIPVETKNQAIFGFNTFHFSDVLSLDFGWRYQERESFRQAQVEFGGVLAATGTFTNPGLQAPVLNGVAGSLPIEGIPPADQNDDSNNITGMLALNYQVSDELSVYGSISLANRAGGVSISPGANVAQIVASGLLFYNEEKSTAFELGFKGRFLDGKATLNGSFFTQEFDGYINRATGLKVVDVAVANATPSNVAGGLTYNGDASVTGVELEGQLQVNDNWRVGGSMSITEGEYDSGAERPCNIRETNEYIGLCSIGGEPISGEPELSISLNTEYVLPLETTDMYLRGLMKYNGERANQDAASGLGVVPVEFGEYATLSLFAGVRSHDGVWDVFGWVKNLTDEDATILHQGSDETDIKANDPANLVSGEYTRVQILPERTMGVTVKYNF